MRTVEANRPVSHEPGCVNGYVTTPFGPATCRTCHGKSVLKKQLPKTSQQKARVPKAPLSSRDHWARTITETAWQTQIFETGPTHGWLMHAERNSVQVQSDGSVRHLTAIQGNAGFPDITMVHERFGVAAFLELKSWKHRKDVSHHQQVWLSTIRRAGLPAAVLTPVDDEMLNTILATGTFPEWMSDIAASLYSSKMLLCDPSLAEN